MNPNLSEIRLNCASVSRVLGSGVPLRQPDGHAPHVLLRLPDTSIERTSFYLSPFFIPNMPHGDITSRIEYSEKYQDDKNEYR
jgi:hypothetical protein